MNLSQCPKCGVKLGNFLYADACPHCHQELHHNTRPMVSVAAVQHRQNPAWLVRVFRRLLKIIES